MYKLQLKPADKMPKYKQIVQSFIADIERGVLKDGAQLPTITELSGEYDLARDTVEKAYRELRERGFLTSVQGKGYYVQAHGDTKLKILLVFNKLSSYKKLIYYAFIEALGDQATVDLQIHHYNAHLFQEIIERSLGKYNYYVVMPHFTLATSQEEYLKVLELIPAEELVLLDKDIPELNRQVPGVFQDFNRDIGGALDALAKELERYPRMTMILPSDDNYPVEIDRGFRQFCRYNDKQVAVKDNATDEVLTPGTAYVVVRETDLVELVKKVRQTSYLLGREIGIITFNETPLKELLNMTVITTDFEQMGRTAAQLILEKKRIKVKNPFYTIRRGSL
ncbi:GntR family transcriptional regulator [Hymenobacter sp.]|uniref:GntR family transcriptional regulator n=1 Tax=Hymenobacter sp. TaxID=1898978 RepID=UPI00286A42D5|nr:GntR family transcriptional regulator [Hymenobacter sp.]